MHKKRAIFKTTIKSCNLLSSKVFNKVNKNLFVNYFLERIHFVIRFYYVFFYAKVKNSIFVKKIKLFFVFIK